MQFWNPMVPELAVSDFGRSLSFYTKQLGFSIRFQRNNPSFAYLYLGKAQLMIEQLTSDSWRTDEMVPPFGRGMNLQIEVPNINEIYGRLVAAAYPIYEPISDEWYRAGAVEEGQREFLVQDPDGYLLRFSEPLGERPL